ELEHLPDLKSFASAFCGTSAVPIWQSPRVLTTAVVMCSLHEPFAGGLAHLTVSPSPALKAKHTCGAANRRAVDAGELDHRGCARAQCREPPRGSDATCWIPPALGHRTPAPQNDRPCADRGRLHVREPSANARSRGDAFRAPIQRYRHTG